jgi:hypothetical protein
MSKAVHYLSTPYTDYCQGREAAFIHAAEAAATMLKRGAMVYSPIAHSHPIAEHGRLDAVDHDLWLTLDLAMLDRCDSLLVVQMPGWAESRGVAAEIAHAEKTGKPISYLSWPMLNVRENESGGHLPASG